MNHWTPRAYDPDFVSGRLPEVINALEEGFAVLDAEGFVQYLNPAAVALLNVDPEAILGWKFAEFEWEIVHPDGTPMDKGEHPSLRALAEGRESPAQILGARLGTVEGTLWLEVSARPLTEPDGSTVVGSVALFRDVGARRAAEEALDASQMRFETLSRLLPVGIFQTDAQGSCTYVNEAWCEISGMDVSAALGQGWMEALHPADRAWVMESWQEAAQAGESFRAEHRYLRPDGEVRWVLCQARAHGPRGGESLGYLGSVTDVTDQKATAAMKDQLIGLVSHELRAPLVAISGALAHLQEHADSLDDPARKLYDMAVRNTGLLQRLVTELLDIDRLSAGVAQLVLSDVNLRHVAHEAAEVVEAVEGQGVTIDLQGIPEDLTVQADHDRILQVFTNLLSNGVKFSEAGSTVAVSATRDEREAVVTVADTGQGIPAGLIEAIFERFVQADPDAEGEPRGMGLGLAIAKAIVGRHGGRIWVESSEGEGSTFFFTLPTQAPADSD